MSFSDFSFSFFCTAALVPVATDWDVGVGVCACDALAAVGKVVPPRRARGNHRGIGQSEQGDFGLYDRPGGGARGADVDEMMASAGSEGVGFPVTRELESGLRVGAAEVGL